MDRVQFIGVCIFGLGILLLAGWGFYLLLWVSGGMPFIIRLALSLLVFGALIVLLSLVRERAMEVKS